MDADNLWHLISSSQDVGLQLITRRAFGDSFRRRIGGLEGVTLTRVSVGSKTVRFVAAIEGFQLAITSEAVHDRLDTLGRPIMWRQRYAEIMRTSFDGTDDLR